MTPNNSRRTPGVIRPDEMYTLREFMRRVGIGDFCFRQWRKDGLPVRVIGKKRYVYGAEAIDWMTAASEAEAELADAAA